MRPGARLAGAALALLALSSPGCKPSSLTPFGLGERGPDPIQGTYSGFWEGSTGAEGEVSFSVVSGEVTDLVLTHRLSCGLLLEFAITDALLIDDGSFTGELAYEPQGRVVVAGTFTAPGACAGTYTFESLAVSQGCPTSGSGRFDAVRAPAATTKESQP